ncbi:MAG TPA: biotin/lipoyl-containing protein, partial [Solirubrobacteraceae bacterium]|nr:biotin/lipoyl-containing protein [Solirubrobacteraceae bacterium]
MTATGLIDVAVPDIGDFTDVPVIEILVGVGDTVAVDDPMVTLESDKATMDVPAPVAGVVRELHIALGDRLSEGSVVLTLEPVAPQDGALPAVRAEAEVAEA